MDIDRSFPRHPLPPPSPEVIKGAKLVRDLFRQLATTLDKTLKPSREKSLALTHLEDASTYASKAIYADGPASINVMRADEKIAQVCHEVNRAYCEALGDTSQPRWEDAPVWQRESAVSGVRFHLEHPDAGPEASHENWLRDKEVDGWKYGSVKDPTAKEHPCFVPFAALPREQQAKDFIFRAVVHALA